MLEGKPKFKLICMNSYHSFSWFAETTASHDTGINGSGTKGYNTRSLVLSFMSSH